MKPVMLHSTVWRRADQNPTSLGLLMGRLLAMGALSLSQHTGTSLAYCISALQIMVCLLHRMPVLTSLFRVSSSRLHVHVYVRYRCFRKLCLVQELLYFFYKVATIMCMLMFNSRNTMRLELIKVGNSAPHTFIFMHVCNIIASLFDIQTNILTSFSQAAPNKMHEQCWDNWYLGKL